VAPADPARTPRLLAAVELTADMVAGVHVIARADKYGRMSRCLSAAHRRLLGRTFVVRTLDAPAAERKSTSGHALCYGQPANWVTSTVIARPAAIGHQPVSRAAAPCCPARSGVLDQQIIDAQRRTAHHQARIERQEHALPNCWRPASRSISRQRALTMQSLGPSSRAVGNKKWLPSRPGECPSRLRVD